MKRCTSILWLSLFVSLLCAAPSTAQSCGGEERWSIKMGSDPGAVALAAATPVSTTVHELISIPAPNLPSDNVTRLPEENTVVVLDGRLVQFRRETGKTGDDDYHLVITDDTLDFTPGGKGTPHTHGLVAEIPNPDCVAGRKNDNPPVSHFAQQLQDMRAKFEQQFPNITEGWNDGGAIHVRITGVRFFDFAHNQAGRAPNVVEIHPILKIEFGSLGPLGTPPTTDDTGTPPAAAPTFQNPGFEDGTTGWTATANVITDSAGERAHTGHGKAWLGGYGVKHTDTLFQDVAIPANVTTVTVSFYLHISTEEEGNQAFDTLKVSVRNAQGAVLKNLATYSNLQSQPGYRLRTFDLSAFRGKTIRLFFQANEDNGSQTSFVLDDFSIAVE